MIRLIRGEQIYFAGCFYLLSGEGYLGWNIGKMWNTIAYPSQTRTPPFLVNFITMENFSPSQIEHTKFFDKKKTDIILFLDDITG